MPDQLPLVTSGMAQHLLCTLAKLGQISAKLTEQRLQALGLRIRHLSALQTLADDGPQSQLRLATTLRMDAATIVSTVDDLEALGLATRTKDPHDRRRHSIELTDKAHGILADAAGHLDALEAEVLADIPAAQRKRIAASLTSLNTSAALVDAYDATRRH